MAYGPWYKALNSLILRSEQRERLEGWAAS
jgi:hypothetical protein